MQATRDNLTSLDLNLLEPLYALLDERHVTRAAERCHLSQPAMSRAFERLRGTFNDELLIRAQRAYVRTAFGDRLFRELQDLLPRLKTALLMSEFEPGTSRLQFRVAATDYAACILVPLLAERVSRTAPAASLSVVPYDESSVAMIDAGAIDLAIACGRSIARLENEPLFTDRFVCVTSHGNQLPDRAVSLDDYIEQRHAIVDVEQGCQPLIDGTLARLSCERRTTYRTQSHLSAALVAGQSGAVCTTARRLALRFEHIGNLRILEGPQEFQTIEYMMGWHRRAREDSANVWLRNQVRDVSWHLT